MAGAAAVLVPGVPAATEQRGADAPPAAEPEGFRLRYILASSMYGTTPVDEILPEVERTGAEALDVWPRVHASQREQIEAMGHAAFRRLLDRHAAKLGMSTRYDLGPFGLQDEIRFVHEFGGRLIVCGAGRGEGGRVREQVRSFVRQMEPHVAAAEEHGVVLGIENHASSLLSSPDSIRWFAEFAASPHLGVALAPYHLPRRSRSSPA